MELTIRQLNDNDYQDILVDWWTKWGWTAPEKDFLPDDGKGHLHLGTARLLPVHRA